MDEKEFKNTVPPNNEGSKTDTAHSEEYQTEEEAIAVYKEARRRLLDVSRWHDFSGTGTADFQLKDAEGNFVSRLAEEGDHFRINIPGPGTLTGDGFDWVQIKSITETSDSASGYENIAIQVKPATNPENDDRETAHFFDESASSTFVVERQGLEVRAEVHGRNEKPNTDTDKLLDKARNLLVAAGAFLGFSEVQWKSLVVGLLDMDKK